MVVLHYWAVGKGRSVASYNSILCSQDVDVGLFCIYPHGCIGVQLRVNSTHFLVWVPCESSLFTTVRLERACDGSIRIKMPIPSTLGQTMWVALLLVQVLEGPVCWQMTCTLRSFIYIPVGCPLHILRSIVRYLMYDPLYQE